LASRRVLVVAAHGDDEVLGAGGTLAWHSRSGDTVRICILSDSETTAPGLEIRRRESPSRLASQASQRRVYTEQAAAALGAESWAMYAFRDNAFDAQPLLHIIYVVEDEIAAFRPDRIYTHHPGDLSRDHGLTAQAVLTAARPDVGPLPDIYSFEVRSSTDWSDSFTASTPFRPNIWHTLTEELVAAKRLALSAYKDEMRAWPHSRSFEAVDFLLRHRGAQVGATAAEAFALLRQTQTLD
jgi:LmbE family N-acetylglucosaminyl deacetylase